MERNSKILIFLNVFLFILSVAALVFVLNVKNYIYPKVLPLNLNPNKVGVLSFGVSQKLYAVVENIEESKENGQIIHTVTLVPAPDKNQSYEDKKIKVVYDKQGWEKLSQIINYWDAKNSKWVSYSDKSIDMAGGIDVTDSVVITNENFHYNISTLDAAPLSNFVTITAVIKK